MKWTIYFLCCLSLILTSCFSRQSGAYVSGVSLTQPNYKYIKSVSGNAHSTYIFGFGGLNKSDLIKGAKQRMYENAKLELNQDIANIVVSERLTTFLLIEVTKEIIITGDVIEWTNTNSLIPREQAFHNQHQIELTVDVKKDNISFYKSCSDKTFYKYKSNYEVEIGDIVYLKESKDYGIITKRCVDVLDIEIFNENGASKIINQNYNEVKVLRCN